MPVSEVYNIDCMECMAKMPDKFFDLAIVDPPYGDAGGGYWDGKERGRFGGRFAKYQIGRSITDSEDGSQSIENRGNVGDKISGRGYL